jgi:hypothetical protein
MSFTYLHEINLCLNTYIVNTTRKFLSKLGKKPYYLSSENCHHQNYAGSGQKLGTFLENIFFLNHSFPKIWFYTQIFFIEKTDM